MEILYTHIWKSAFLATVFYGFYRLILDRETFFKSIRFFLIVGIIASIALPFIYIPTYITIEQVEPFIVNSANNGPLTYETSIEWSLLLTYLYIAVTIIFLIKFIFQLISIALLIYRSECRRIDSFYMIETDSQTSPFSFFNFIVYNPKAYNKKELKQIIAHEKAHAIQKHSIDTLLSNLFVAFFWFNPFVWFYRNKMEQNLEFIADEYAQNAGESSRDYQELLLKTTLPNYQMALANNFYNSLLKKRIIMLHTQRSNNKSQWKFALIAPLLLGFLFIFNTKTIAQQKKSTKKIIKKKVEIFAMMLDKATTDKGMEDMAKRFSEKGLTIKFSGVKRNKDGEITAIKINAKSKDGKTTTSYAINGDESIKSIQLSFDEENKSVSIGAVDSLHSHTYAISKKGEGNSFIFKSESDDGEDKTWISKKGSKKVLVEIIEDHDDHEDGDHDIEETIIIDSDGKKAKKEIIKVRKKGDNKFVFISGDDNKSPLILLNGKEISQKELDAIDTDTIESINVYKGEKATKKYGDKAKNGVVVITSKKE